MKRSSVTLKFFAKSLFGIGALALLHHRVKNDMFISCSESFKVKNSTIYDPLWRSKIRKPIKNKESIFLISGTANRDLSIEVADRLNLKLEDVQINTTSDGECSVSMHNSPQGKIVFIIQPTSPSVNNNLVELLFLICEAKRGGAKQVNVILPYLGYSTFTKSLDHKIPICSADVATMLKVSGADSVITLDVHSGQIEGFYDIPFDDLSSNVVLTEYLLNSNLIPDFDKLMIIAPKADGVKRAKNHAESITKRTDIPINIAMTMETLHLSGSHTTRASILVGQVENSDCIIVDDMIKTGYRVIESAEELKRKGARKVYVYVPHCKKY